MFSSSYEQPKSKQWFYRNFALHSQHYSCVENGARENSIDHCYCSSKLLFILMSGVMVEAEMYDTDNKRSLDLGEIKKESCLNFWKFAYFVSKIISNEPIIWLN